MTLICCSDVAHFCLNAVTVTICSDANLPSFSTALQFTKPENGGNMEGFFLFLNYYYLFIYFFWHFNLIIKFQSMHTFVNGK